ncbi:unnamed protein product [Lathyrus sativus]|nr:unnamed protein product [Lathyrus sativus]
MLVHRSTESLVIERLDIPATAQRALPSNGTHSSSWMKTIESWNMMNYHQSRLRGRWEPWYYDFYNYLKDGFISEYATRGQRRAWRRTCPTICDLGRCPLQKVLQGCTLHRKSRRLKDPPLNKPLAEGRFESFLSRVIRQSLDWKRFNPLLDRLLRCCLGLLLCPVTSKASHRHLL